MACKLNHIKPPEKRRESLGQIIRKTIGLWSGSKGSISHRKLVLVRCLVPVVPFSPTQNCINPGERIKKSNADLRFAGNERTGYGEKSKSLFSRFNLTPR